MSKEKKVVIDIRMFCLENKIKVKDVCEDFSVSGVTLYNWRIEATEAVKVLYKVWEISKIDILEFLNNYNYNTNALLFVRDFMIKYNAKFEDIIYEIN